jgi:hypothetical protein
MTALPEPSGAPFGTEASPVSFADTTGCSGNAAATAPAVTAAARLMTAASLRIDPQEE